MRLILAANWWSLVIRGLAGILMGVITFAWPGITLAALVLLFGAYSLIDGVFSVVGAVKAARAHERWGTLVLSGVMGIAAAVITVVRPALTALALIYLIAAWAVVTGILEIVAAVKLRRYIDKEWLLALAGICSVVFGALVMITPLAGALVIALWIGAYALVSGVILVALGFKLRSWERRQPTGRTQIPIPAH
jgi:uncharacterized membrane protein HdeD (DUF308 family)